MMGPLCFPMPVQCITQTRSAVTEGDYNILMRIYGIFVTGTFGIRLDSADMCDYNYICICKKKFILTDIKKEEIFL